MYQGSSVFNRLGGKGKKAVKRAAATSTVPDSDDDSDSNDSISDEGLEYAGVLKAGSPKKPKVDITAIQRKKSLQLRLGMNSSRYKLVPFNL